MKLYVASSWRNIEQPAVVQQLRLDGHEVYDFRNPSPCNKGFSWSEIDPNWRAWNSEEFRCSLDHPIAERGFKSDYDAMKWADACVMVMPCGRSAHLEAGYFVGAKKPLIILLSDAEPELMYKMADCLCVSIEEAMGELRCLRDKQYISNSEQCHACGSVGLKRHMWVTREGNALCRACYNKKYCQGSEVGQ